MTSARPEAQPLDSLRAHAAHLRATGPTTSRRRVVLHVLGLGAAVALAAGPFGLAGDVAASVLMAVWFLHADAMQHEAAHRHVARSPAGNRLVGLLASVPMLVPYSWYRAFHHAHHAHTAQPDDPEGRHEPAPRWPWVVEAGRTVRFWAKPWVASARAFGGAARASVRRGHQLRDLRIDATITALAGAALLAGAFAVPVIRWVWFGPLMLYVLVLFPMFHTYEHAGAEARAASQPDLDALGRTSTLRLPRLLSAVLWHATLHTAHHAFPSVPWQRLPELQDHLDEHLAPELVYQRLGDYVRSPGRAVSTTGTSGYSTGRAPNP